MPKKQNKLTKLYDMLSVMWKMSHTGVSSDIVFVFHKGQLISGWNFGVFKSSKNWTFFWQISALASKMDQIKKDKGNL